MLDRSNEYDFHSTFLDTAISRTIWTLKRNLHFFSFFLVSTVKNVTRYVIVFFPLFCYHRIKNGLNVKTYFVFSKCTTQQYLQYSRFNMVLNWTCLNILRLILQLAHLQLKTFFVSGQSKLRASSSKLWKVWYSINRS